jgi:hypothetical protein
MSTLTICDLIRLHMHQKSLTTRQAAEKCSIPYQTFRSYQLGLQRPNRASMDKIIAGFDLKMADIINEPRLMKSEREHLEGMYK